MPPAPQPYLTGVQATADSSGEARVRFDGPGFAWDILDVELITMDVTGSTSVPEARLYRGDPATGQLLGVNADGISGQFRTSGASDRIESGRVWWLVWTGATAGAVCNATLTGTIRRR